MTFASIIQQGTKLWLDSVDPSLAEASRSQGFTGATSNPIIIAGLLGIGVHDEAIRSRLARGKTAEEVAWELTDAIVSRAEKIYRPVFEATGGEDGYVSFELDPLLESENHPLSAAERVAEYVRLGRAYSEGHPNRMIKVPATATGIAALEELAYHGVPLNVTLIFTRRQYEQARDAVWRGMDRAGRFESLKSVYSIFVSRVDAYTERACPELSSGCRGQVAIVNAKTIWRLNQEFWREHPTRKSQEIVFASTGTKDPAMDPCTYVAAFVGSDIETNPPATNDAVARSGRTFTREIDRMPPPAIVDEILDRVPWDALEADLLQDGVDKFVAPQRALIETVASFG